MWATQWKEKKSVTRTLLRIGHQVHVNLAANGHHVRSTQRMIHRRAIHRARKWMDDASDRIGVGMTVTHRYIFLDHACTIHLATSGMNNVGRHDALRRGREGGRGGEGGADIRGIGERWESNWKLKDSKFRNFCTYVYYIFAGICYTLWPVLRGKLRLKAILHGNLEIFIPLLLHVLCPSLRVRRTKTAFRICK